MGYDLHIEHPRDPFLDFDKWEAAVRSTKGLRPTKARDGEWDGTAEIRLKGKWIPVFQWSSGSVTFELGDASEEVLTAALALAAKVNSQVQGDDGEIYASLDDLMAGGDDDDDKDHFDEDLELDE